MAHRLLVGITLIANVTLFSEKVYCQDKQVADSLLFLLESNSQSPDSILFQIHHQLAYYYPETEQALFHGLKALDIAKSTGSNLNIGRSLELIGVNHRMLGNKASGFEASYEALRIYDSLKLDLRCAHLHLQIGGHLGEDENYDQAIVQLKKSVAIFDSLNNIGTQMAALINLGETYRLNKELSKAKVTFESVLKLNDNSENLIIEGYALGNLGLTNNKLGYPKLAKTQLEEAISILSKIGDLYSLSVYQAELGSINIVDGNIRKGENQLLKAFELAKNESIKKQIRDISMLLAEFYESRSQFEKAYEFQKKYQVYQDSLVNASNIRKIEEIKSNYEISKKNSEIERLALENRLAGSELEQKKSELIFTASGILFLIMLIGLIYYAYTNKKKSNIELLRKNDIIGNQIKEKELLHKEIYHRVKNNLQLIGSIMGLHSQATGNEEVSEAMSTGKSRVEAMTIIHQNLFAQDHNVQINLPEYLEKLVANLRSTYQDQVNSINLNFAELNVNTDDAIPIGLIINEGICNAVKYGGKQSLDLQVDFNTYKNGYLLKISDNGSGISTKEIKEEGFGTKLINTLARQLKAELTIDSSTEGTSVQLRFDHLSPIMNTNT